MAQGEDGKDWPSELRDEERYEAIRQKLIRYFAVKRCYDPEELADETITRVVRKIDSWRREAVEFEAFLSGFARNVAHERCHGVKGEKQFDDSSLEVDKLVGSSGNPELTPQDEAAECLRQCLQKMKPQEQELIIGYYQGGNKEGDLKRARGQLAITLGLTLKALGLRAMRLRIRLERCVQECLRKK